MPRKKASEKTEKTEPAKSAKSPKPPSIVRVHYSVPRSLVVEMDGSRYHFHAEDRRGLRRSRPLLVDDVTWAKLQSTPAVQRMLAKGQISEVTR